MSLVQVKTLYQTTKQSLYKYIDLARNWIFNLPTELKTLWEAKEDFSTNNYLLARYHWMQQNNTDTELRLRLVIAGRHLAADAFIELALLKYRHNKKENALAYLEKANSLQPKHELIAWAKDIMQDKVPTSIPETRWNIFREHLSFEHSPFRLINKRTAIKALSLLKQNVENYKPQKTLEIGTSNITLANMLKEDMQPKHSTIIEGHPKLIPPLENLTAPTGEIYDILIKSDYNKYLIKVDKAFKPTGFDLIFANNTLLTEISIDKYLKNIRLLLSKSGWFVASFPIASETRLDISYSYFVYGKEALKASIAKSGFTLIANEVVKFNEQFDEFMVILCQAN